MIRKSCVSAVFGAVFLIASTMAFAEPITYIVDPRHTFPAFEADHQGGLSIWRGKIERSSGRIVLDREARTGTVEMTMDMASIDFGLEAMNEHAKAEDILDVARFPTATYTGTLVDFNEAGDPRAVEGSFTLHGVTLPLRLEIRRFLCKTNNQGIDTCGADAWATFNRDDHGVDYGKSVGFDMFVNLLIQVEARREGPPPSS